MKSNYNQLGQYIEMVSRTNSDLKYGIEDVRGCSNTKQMMQTRANLIGRTYEKFIVLRPQEFVFNRRTTRNGEKIGMAYNNTDREYIFTNDYVAFRVKQEYLDKLLPDYLYLFFCRDEFDRYARYKSTGSATEFFNWEDMCAVPFEIPQMDFQQLIVNAYKVLNERIETKQKINDNLEETASAIFKSYFVTFEHYGGNMPKNWKQATIGDVVSVSRGASPRPIQDYISQSGMPWVKISDASSSVSKYLFKTAEYIIPEGIQNSRTVTKGMMIVSNSASPGLPMIMEITACVHDGWLIIDDYDCVTQEFMYYHFLNERQSLISSSNGSVFNNLKIDIVKSHPIIIPDEETMTKVTQQFRRLNKAIKQNAKEINSLVELQYNLLSKLSNY